MPPPALLEAVEGLQPIGYSGPAFRHLAAKWNPLSGAGARTQGGRWNPPDSFSTLYLAVERQTAVAEFIRMAERSGRTPQDFLPRHLHRYGLQLSSLVDLREPGARSAVGLKDHELRSNNPVLCQEIGESAHLLGAEGVIAPSATESGTVIAVFIDRLEADSIVSARDFEEWVAPPG